MAGYHGWSMSNNAVTAYETAVTGDETKGVLTVRIKT